VAGAIDRARFDLWRYAVLMEPVVPDGARLTLGEGWTPSVMVPALARAIGLERLVLKREDLNPTGSHKARGLAFQVSAEVAADPPPKWLVISSSGNAAVAAAAYCRLAGVNLGAFVSPRTEPAKLVHLARFGAHVFLTDRPIELAQVAAEALAAPNLRPSTHRWGTEGFQTIGWELLETIDPVEALFTLVSSGSSLVGIGRAFARSAAVIERPWQPALHAVQGCGASPIAGEFDKRPRPPAESGVRLGALGARKTRRAAEAKRLIRDSGGSGWVVSDAEALVAARLLADHGVATSIEGAASLAGAMRAAREVGVGSAVVILTGHVSTAPPEFLSLDQTGRLHHVGTAAEVVATLDHIGAGAMDRGAIRADGGDSRPPP
jgi:threonine synthase